MIRPTILVAEPEPEQALSVRKLVLETAKFNVLTAHSNAEAAEIAQMFPNISAAILVKDAEMDCETMVRNLRQTLDIPIVAVAPQTAYKCKGADHNVSSHEPEKLLELMRSLLGDPRKLDGSKRPGAAPKSNSKKR
jgi:CheY-like chemotaxis protein